MKSLNKNYSNRIKKSRRNKANKLSKHFVLIFKNIKDIPARILKLIKVNKILFLIICVYLFFVLIGLSSGTPNNSHPFLYNMDEWHMFMSIKSIIKHGTTTITGAAQIPFLYPVLSGLYLVPFVLLGIINPFILKSPLENLLVQKRIFEILRSVNIFFGIGSIILTAKIAKNYLRINPIVPVFFFALSPILLSLSGFFKYDVALLFFITLSLDCLYKFGKDPVFKNYVFASIASGLALATKFSAAPLLPLTLFAYFWFKKNKKIQYKFIFLGVLTFLITLIIFGIPNVLIGRADYRELLYSNLVTGPGATNNLLLPYPWWIYLSIRQYPYTFGHAFFYVSVISLVCIAVFLISKYRWKNARNKNYVFLLLGFFLFSTSLIPLKINATGNRILVLLPFLSLITGVAVSQLYHAFHGKFKNLFVIFISILIISHLVESSILIYTKLHIDPQQISSEWIEKHIPSGSHIGLENIPIYQSMPNIILKEFYFTQYNTHNKTKYTYEVIDVNTKKIPSVVIISYDEIDKRVYRNSSKKSLIKRLNQEGYRKIAVFTPDLTYHKFIGNDEDYYFSGLISSPLSISVYKQ